MTLDPLLLSRLQFVWVVAWHILLPAFTLGLASYIAFVEALHLATRRPIYLRVSNFWIRIFSVAFGMGVVSGIVMPFQFGTNWSRFSLATANVLSPLLAYEGLVAFFLESAFLGVLLFGRKLVPPWAHFVAALMVALGTLFSAFWILATNSWMQTPAGYSLVDGRFFPQDWTAIIFNPSFPYRLFHTVVGFYITHRLRGDGRGGVADPRPPLRRGGALHALLHALAAARAGAGADGARRSARAEHARTPAGQARRDRGALGHRHAGAADPVRDPRPGARDQPLRDRGAAARQPDPDP